MKQSKFLHLNWRDAINGILVAAGSGALKAISLAYTAGTVDFKLISEFALLGGGSYIIKNFFSGDKQNLTPDSDDSTAN